MNRSKTLSSLHLTPLGLALAAMLAAGQLAAEVPCGRISCEHQHVHNYECNVWEYWDTKYRFVWQPGGTAWIESGGTWTDPMAVVNCGAASTGGTCGLGNASLKVHIYEAKSGWHAAQGHVEYHCTKSIDNL